MATTRRSPVASSPTPAPRQMLTQSLRTDHGPFHRAVASKLVESANQVEQRRFWSARILRYGQQFSSQHGGTEKRRDRYSEGRGRTAAQNAVGWRIRSLQQPSD